VSDVHLPFERTANRLKAGGPLDVDGSVLEEDARARLADRDVARRVDFRAAVTTAKSTPSARSWRTSSTVRSDTTPSPIVLDGRSRHSRRSPVALSTTQRFASASRLTILAPCSSNHDGKWTSVPSRSLNTARRRAGRSAAMANTRRRRSERALLSMQWLKGQSLSRG